MRTAAELIILNRCRPRTLAALTVSIGSMIPPTAAAAPRALANSCFVYGTLMSREVVEGLVGRCPDMRPALLYGHSRFPVVDQVYPGMLPASEASEGVGVRGMLMTGIRPNELERFDWFEDIDNGEYERVAVNILAPSQGKGDSEDDHHIMASSDQIAFTDSNNPNDINGWEKFQTEAYIYCSTENELDKTKSWSYERFRRENLDWYLTNTVAYCRKELDDSGIGLP